MFLSNINHCFGRKSGPRANNKYAQLQPGEAAVFDSDKNKRSERQPYTVISVPCTNDWAKEKNTDLIDECPRISSNFGCKRTLDERDKMDCSEPLSKKSAENDPLVVTVQNSDIGSHRNLLPNVNLKAPIEDGKSCMIMIYGVSYKLNQIVDVIGFVSSNPVMSTNGCSDETMDDDAEFQTIPSYRLHAIQIREVRKSDETANAEEVVSKAESIRGDLQMVLSQLFFGDKLAADYLICHLISSVYLRKDCLALGSFPLNITHFPLKKYKTFPEDFYEVLAMLVPKSRYLGISLDELNNLCLTPREDHENNRLVGGMLQLSDNTHLVVDETKLTPGPVSPYGKKNYKAIRDLVEYQTVSYDFKFYTKEFEADVPVLILSESHSIIPCSMQIKLKTEAKIEELYPNVLEAARQFLKDKERLSSIRRYLEILRHTDFQFNEEIVDVIQEDYVKMRQSDNGISSDNLHSLMVLARLVSLSHGSNKLTIGFWKEALQMETERMGRVSLCSS